MYILNRQRRITGVDKLNWQDSEQQNMLTEKYDSTEVSGQKQNKKKQQPNPKSKETRWEKRDAETIIEIENYTNNLRNETAMREWNAVWVTCDTFCWCLPRACTHPRLCERLSKIPMHIYSLGNLLQRSKVCSNFRITQSWHDTHTDSVSWIHQTHCLASCCAWWEINWTKILFQATSRVEKVPRRTWNQQNKTRCTRKNAPNRTILGSIHEIPGICSFQFDVGNLLVQKHVRSANCGESRVKSRLQQQNVATNKSSSIWTIPLELFNWILSTDQLFFALF